MNAIRKPKRKKQSVSKLAKRVKPKTVKYLRKLAWTLLSKIVRNKYADHRGFCTCYTCGSVGPMSEMQAGHAIGGRNNSVLLDESIIRVQCVRCNIFLRGNYPVFAAKLIRENGLEWWEKKLIESSQTKIYTREDLNEIILGYRIRLQAIERGVPYETPKDAVEVFDTLDGVKSD